MVTMCEGFVRSDDVGSLVLDMFKYTHTRQCQVMGLTSPIESGAEMYKATYIFILFTSLFYNFINFMIFGSVLIFVNNNNKPELVN
jgi:hypothetical protein